MTLTELACIAALAYGQNVAFALVSRARNRDHIAYHLIASVISNAVWFLTFKQLVSSNMSLEYFAPYTTGTVLGSVSGAKVSMSIERYLGAASDSHIPRK